MNMRKLAGLSLSALMLGGTMVGCTHGGGIASASSKSDAAAAKQAAVNADKASKALAAGDAVKAVSFAEAAVALRPSDAGYRALLGASYLKAGRFASAHTSYADVLSLSPSNGKAALNLALAQIAEGQWADARKTLDAHADIIAASDRGLAIALAGDPAAGVDVLVAATRTPEADGKTRQNLALAMALAGRWQEARSIIGVDMAPAEADQRIMQWASFAKPVGAADQVAALLGVHPANDPGQPVALALNAAVPVASAEANTDAVDAAMPGRADAAVESAALSATPEPALASAATPALAPSIAVEAIPASAVAVAEAMPVAVAPPKTIPAKGAFKTKVAALAVKPTAKPALAVAPRAPAKGNWYVQLGAFDSPGVAKDAWARAQRRFAGFAGQSPAGMAFKSNAGSFYRLSVGGFARPDADAMCKGFRAKGGTCFVRAGAGDQVAQWVKPAKVQLASR